MKFIIASNNIGKIAEFSEILRSLGFDAAGQSELGQNCDPEETGSTFEENALIKAEALFTSLSGKYAVVADDSGLMVDALGGKPGVYSKRFAENDEKCIKKLLLYLDGVPLEKRTARFVSAIASILPSGKKFTVTGICSGRIIFEPRGNKGFGYDPVFMPDGYDTTFGELSGEIKNKISHRYNAAMEFSKILTGYLK